MLTHLWLLTLAKGFHQSEQNGGWSTKNGSKLSLAMHIRILSTIFLTPMGIKLNNINRILLKYAVFLFLLCAIVLSLYVQYS